MTGDYVVQLVVSDGKLDSEPDTVVVTAETAVPGDLNYDGTVDSVDLGIFSASYYKCEGQPEYNPDCDFNNSGCVNYWDYWIFYKYYRKY